MVLLNHIGFGGRDRPIWLYYWDLRDGADFAGWWVTPDIVGNMDFFLHCNDVEAATPMDCAVGAWRSPNVEMLQLKRKLSIGFAEGGSSLLVAVGDDANLPIVPDNMCQVNFSEFAWKQEGFNHGRPCYTAVAKPPPPEGGGGDAAGGDKNKAGGGAGGGSGPSPLLLVALGVAVGAIVVLAGQRAMGR